MNILVTGGAGFIGRHLVGRLATKGHNVTIFDNFSSSKKDPIEAKIIEGDVRDADDVKRAVKGCDFVFHLAAITEALSKDEDAVYNVNFMGSKNVFEAAKDAGAKVVFTSSAAVYGESKLAKESDETHPANQYGKSKLRAEKICPDTAFVVRLFNVYGPNGHGVINKFCRLIPNYEDVTVYGHGTQTRDFIYVDDIVSALMLGLDNNGLYNVGTGKETSLLQIIDMIHNTTKSKPNVKFAAPLAGDVMRSRADITNIMPTGWRPKVDLQEGIELTLKSCGVDLEFIKTHLK